jgi:hypothetical protein
VRYFLAYRFIFQSPNWFKNLLWGSLCFFVPIVGPMVLVGYLFEVIEWLHRRREEEKLPWVEPTGVAAAPEGAIQVEPGGSAGGFEYAAAEQYPDFNVNRIQEYLTRGIWPFLVQLVVGLPVGMVLGFLPTVGVLLIMAAVASDAHPLVIVAIILVLLAVYFGAFVLLALVQVPLYLRAGLRRDFGSAFSMAFLKDFLKRVWLELLLSQLFLHVTGAALVLVGFLCCFVGAYPASAWMMMATHHIDLQLYELYLQRGGEPVRPREDRVSAEKSL